MKILDTPELNRILDRISRADRLPRSRFHEVEIVASTDSRIVTELSNFYGMYSEGSETFEFS